MAETTYSVYFTGHWLSKPVAGTQLDLLRTLFPHADAERLSHFLDRRRVLLIHGEPLEEAERIVRTLLDHGLDCEIVEDADSPPDLSAVMKPQPARPQSGRDAQAAPAHAPHVWHDTPVHHEGEEEFSPLGRKLLGALAGAVAILVIVASWAAWHRLHRGPAANVADMPATCATDTQTTWYGRTTANVLVCAARTDKGARYHLVLSCDRQSAVHATLALFDELGAPRPAPWTSSSPGSALSIRYAIGGAVTQPLTLERTDQPNVGALPAVDGKAAARILAASSLDIAGLFGQEAAHFDLDSARWYIDYFTGACGLADGNS